MNTEYLSQYLNKVRISYFAPNGEKWISSLDSLVVDEHFNQLEELLSEIPIESLFGGYFDIFYDGKRIFAGDGPSISKSAVQLAAKLGAAIESSVYCSCDEE